MSMDTMLEIAECLGISLDYMIWGKADDGELPEDLRSLLSYLQNCDEKKRKKAVKFFRYICLTERKREKGERNGHEKESDVSLSHALADLPVQLSEICRYFY